MKYLVSLLFFAVSVHAADYSDDIKYAIEQLRATKTRDGMPVMAGYSSNIGGSHGTFYLLWPYFFARASREDVALMLADPNPLIRILGARRVLTPFLRPLPVEALEPLAKDMAEIQVGPIYEPDYHFATMTVAAVVAEMKKNPTFLFTPYHGERVRLAHVLEAQPLRTVQAVEMPLPEYPPELVRAGISGEVTLRFVVQGDNSVADVVVVKSSQREFETVAKSAVSRWRFSRPPGSEPGKPEPAVLECRIVFDFKGD